MSLKGITSLAAHLGGASREHRFFDLEDVVLTDSQIAKLVKP